MRVKNVVEFADGDGVIRSVSKTFNIKLPAQDSFYMSYIENMSGFFKITAAVDMKVLVKLCHIAGYNTGEVSLDTHTRGKLIESLGINSSQLSRSLSKLKELELISGDKGFFVINPAVFWKGQNEVRQKLMDKGFEIKVSIDGFDDKKIKL